MDDSPQPKRLVEFGPLADQDFTENHDHTAFHWGIEQAERYSKILIDNAYLAAENPTIGKRIEGFPEFRALFIKWPKAKYGHFIVYRTTEKGIYVLRILHSAMNIDSHL